MKASFPLSNGYWTTVAVILLILSAVVQYHRGVSRQGVSWYSTVIFNFRPKICETAGGVERVDYAVVYDRFIFGGRTVVLVLMALFIT